MQAKMEWSLETYRLEEIERKFALPCVICLTEGFYSDTDTEGFSQGDVISIDSKLVLYKVAANFAYNTIGGQLDPNNVELAEKEILVPLNYKGKLKVLRKVKDFNSVRELSTEFPRYAKVRKKMKVTTERNVHVTIQAGTVIELDRIIPGHLTEHGEQPAKLVIQFQDRTAGEIGVAVPLDVRGKFRTEPDYNEYTIKEAINRYELPQLIRFVDDEIKRVYTQDLLEGIENMRTITSETLRLNRLVIQNVLVGHYKPVDENETHDTKRFRQRTLAVLPLDKREIRAIEVHVLKGVTEDIYEQVFLVRNVSKTSSAAIIEGSLYIDFVMRPRMKIISNQDTEHEGHKNKESPPPLHPKPRQLKLQQKVKSNQNTRQKVESNEDERGYVKFNPAKDAKDDRRRDFQSTKPPEVKPLVHKDLDGYEIPKASHSILYDRRRVFPSKKPPEVKPLVHEDQDGYEKPITNSPFNDRKRVPSTKLSEVKPLVHDDIGGNQRPKTSTLFSPECMETCLAETNFNLSGSLNSEKKTSGLISSLKNKWRSKDNVSVTAQVEPVKAIQHVPAAIKYSKSTTPVVTEIKHLTAKVKPTKPDVKFVSEEGYNEVDERKMLGSPHTYHRAPYHLRFKGGTSDRNSNLKPSEVKQKPTAYIAPSNSHLGAKTKQFKDLNNAELVQRLHLCGLDEFARFCEKENLNGAFFTSVSKETLSNDLNLTGILLLKFLKIRDSDWLPT